MSGPQSRAVLGFTDVSRAAQRRSRPASPPPSIHSPAGPRFNLDPATAPATINLSIAGRDFLHMHDRMKGMVQPDSTCWTVIEGAAAGHKVDRDEFARRYASAIRAYLAARWQGSPFAQELDDATQEVFLECFRQGGVLQRADRSRPGGFRAFLYGVVRNVALRIETRRAQGRERQPESGFDPEGVEGSEASLSRAFDRAWAECLLRDAAQRQADRARQAGEAALKRVELLRLRFREGLPIREIARLWGSDPAVLHREYARARAEFKEALLEVVAFHQPGSGADVEKECGDLLAFLQ